MLEALIHWAKANQLLLVLVLCGAMLGVAFEKMRAAMRRRSWRARNASRIDGAAILTKALDRQWWANREPPPPARPDAADQLRIVMRSDFDIRPLLNKGEARVFRELDRIVLDCNPEWQVMAQVSLGEILRCNDPEAYGCINSKRVDLLLVDGECRPRHAVEYQGGAHYQGSSAARDAIKKEALRRAGITYHEVVAGKTTPSELRRLVEKLVDKPASPRTSLPDRTPRSASG